MDIKKHSCKIGVFIINLLIVVLAVCGMRDRDKSKFSFEKETEESLVPVDSAIQEIQNKIATERENKLRDLNTEPKVAEQQNITTTKKTTTPVETKKSDKKTKTS